MDVTLVAPIDIFSTKPGGTRSYVLNLARELATKKIKITLLAINSPQDNQKFNSIPIAKGTKVSSLTFLLNLFIRVPFLKIPTNSIIHVQSPENIIPFLIFNRKNPKIITVHGRKDKMDFIFMKGKLKGSFLNFIDYLLIPRFDRIIAINDETKNFYLSQYPQLNEKISVILNGVDLNEFKPIEYRNKNKYGINKEKKTILYVGRFDKIKGLDLLLHAIKLLQDEDLKFQLILVGEGPEKSPLIKIIEKLRLKNVRFIETIEHSEIPDIMNCADVFALCSLGEGMPTVVLESLACGVSVVSTKVGDVHKVVRDGISGYLIEKRTPEDIAKKLTMALNEGSKFKLNCISIAREYSWDNIGDKIISVYEEAIKRRNHFHIES